VWIIPKTDRWFGMALMVKGARVKEPNNMYFF